MIKDMFFFFMLRKDLLIFWQKMAVGDTFLAVGDTWQKRAVGDNFRVKDSTCLFCPFTNHSFIL